MKYLLFFLLLLAITIVIPLSILYLIEKKKEIKIKVWKKTLVTIFSSLVMIFFIICAYLGIFYRSTSDAFEALKSDELVNVSETSDYYFFDNKDNTSKAIIFYPGGKVEESAYAPLMHEISSNGIDVYIIKMPFHFALLGINKAEKALNNTNYQDIYLMGHSLGGASISMYLTKSNRNFKGIIYLASYPCKKIDKDISSLSIYGSNDGVLNKNSYNKGKDLLPKTNYEFIIEGGNHAYFGNYGEQRKDGVASITRKHQQEITTNTILKFIEGTI